MNEQQARDAVAKAMCAIETRSKAASLEEVQAGIQRWMRHRHEAERLIEELSDYGLEVRKRPEPEWEYVPGHRWVDRDGKERWFVQAGTIAEGYLGTYIADGGQVIRRQVGPWEQVNP